MRTAEIVTFATIRQAEAKHEDETLSLRDAVLRLQQAGCTRHEAYVRLEAIAVNQAMVHQAARLCQKDTSR